MQLLMAYEYEWKLKRRVGYEALEVKVRGSHAGCRSLCGHTFFDISGAKLLIHN